MVEENEKIVIFETGDSVLTRKLVEAAQHSLQFYGESAVRTILVIHTARTLDTPEYSGARSIVASELTLEPGVYSLLVHPQQKVPLYIANVIFSVACTEGAHLQTFYLEDNNVISVPLS